MWTKPAILLICLLPSVSMNLVIAQSIPAVPTEDQEFAQLGVEVTDSPGVGVQVEVVAVDGPADQSGIRPGDYLMAINGEPIDQPDDLIATIHAQNPGTAVSVRVWHDGEETEMKIVLATSGSTVQRTDRAWLGVTLEVNGNVGAKIGQVIPGSPASDAKLKEGDVIVAINDTEIESAKDLVTAIESHKSGDRITLTLAGETENPRQVKLGALAVAPPIFSHRMPIPELDEIFPDSFAPPSWHQEMSDLRRKVQELQDAIRKQGKGDLDLDEEDAESQDPTEHQPGDVSELNGTSALFQFVDYDLRRGDAQSRSSHDGYRYRPTYRYSYQYRPNYGYRYGYVPRAIPYSSYYGRYPNYRSYYRPYYRAGAQLYIGPFGVQYYYR
ncbi:PDZ domain-containing protein [Rubripirellula reticaptiva]|uniref:Putative periplasmic serine endoprotease DegP-like n=1 Tax=Rubripirellula reticaptiva TaxID=2528013 RepID=A0A5C6ECF4_9BACT|nr:PDZ domain-containing protein [Rubripirellula reticaptiva]TWU46682.1 putative periplasmic serine endoprotease DegP-like precursor [Rubripirellula reticaptiva]